MSSHISEEGRRRKIIDYYGDFTETALDLGITVPLPILLIR